jgi:hypothetical protein
MTFYYVKTFMRNHRKYQNHRKALGFFNKSKNNFYLFKLASELQHNQFLIYFLHNDYQIFVNVVISKY